MSPPQFQPRKRMTQQLSLRLSDEQRTYVRAQLDELRDADGSRDFAWSEADVIRAVLDQAVRGNWRLAKTAGKAS